MEININKLKNRVKFSRKKKCDVCKQNKLVSHECEECYSDGFEKTINNFFKAGGEDMKKQILEVLSKYPRTDNYSRNGKLVSANSIIREEITNTKHS